MLKDQRRGPCGMNSRHFLFSSEYRGGQASNRQQYSVGGSIAAFERQGSIYNFKLSHSQDT